MPPSSCSGLWFRSPSQLSRGKRRDLFWNGRQSINSYQDSCFFFFIMSLQSINSHTDSRQGDEEAQHHPDQWDLEYLSVYWF